MTLPFGPGRQARKGQDKDEEEEERGKGKAGDPPHAVEEPFLGGGGRERAHRFRRSSRKANLGHAATSRDVTHHAIVGVASNARGRAMAEEGRCGMNQGSVNRSERVVHEDDVEVYEMALFLGGAPGSLEAEVKVIPCAAEAGYWDGEE
jgi:hypothetical protein